MKLLRIAPRSALEDDDAADRHNGCLPLEAVKVTPTGEAGNTTANHLEDVGQEAHNASKCAISAQLM